MESKNHNLPQNWVTTQEVGPTLPDHYVLYKTIAAPEMGEDQWIRDRDFNLNSNKWYWTLEPETAEQYTARRCSLSDTWII